MKIILITFFISSLSFCNAQLKKENLILTIVDYHRVINTSNDNLINLRLENKSSDTIILNDYRLCFIRMKLENPNNDTFDSRHPPERIDYAHLPLKIILLPGMNKIFKVRFDYFEPPKKGKYKVKYFIETETDTKPHKTVESSWVKIKNNFNF